jgi:acetyl esterase/lipase
MRWNGETAIPKPTVLPQGINITLPSRESGRSIPCRVFYPSDDKEVRGVFMHIHGGGWVLTDEKSSDLLLAFYADAGDLLVISVGYRLAPENPFPRGPEDCFDVADYLIENSEKEHGAPLRFIGGEVRCTVSHLEMLASCWPFLLM